MAETKITTGRGGKNNFPTSQPPNTEPGDNAKYLTHAMAVRALPKIDTTDPVQVEGRIQLYFEMCAAADMKPTVTGFLMALDVSKTTLWEWKNGVNRKGTHQEIIVRAYGTLEALWEDYMMNGKINPVSGIFLGKNNFGYQDKQEYVVTPNTKEIEVADVKAIEAKYAELPAPDDDLK